MIFTDSSLKDSGRFLFWTWERWEIGGGAGVQWYLFGKPVYMPNWSPLWNLVRSRTNETVV